MGSLARAPKAVGSSRPRTDGRPDLGGGRKGPWATLLGIAVLALVACGDEGPIEPPVELEGDYELHSVDGIRPPVPLPEMFDPGPLRCEASQRELTRGLLTLQLGHYHMTLHVRETCEASSDPEIHSSVVQGRYESDGTAVVLLRLKHGGDPRDGEPVLEGALEADTLTLEVVEGDGDFSFTRMADQE